MLTWMASSNAFLFASAARTWDPDASNSPHTKVARFGASSGSVTPRRSSLHRVATPSVASPDLSTAGQDIDGICTPNGSSSSAGELKSRGEPASGCEGAIGSDRVSDIADELVRLGGTDCGWESEDHARYMRIRTQVLGSSTLCGKSRLDGRLQKVMDRAALELPTHDMISIEEHESRVARREQLVDERREILKRWRNTREDAVISKRKQVLCIGCGLSSTLST